MPTLAMMAKGEVGNKDIEDFIKILDTKIHEAKDQLIERFEYICSQSPDSAKFMYENNRPPRKLNPGFKINDSADQI